MVFDSRAAKTLAPGAVLTVADCPGLRLLATKSGKTWTYRYLGPGERLKQIAIGRWPELTLADAIAKWHELRALKEQGVDPVARKKALRAAAKATPAPPKSYTVALLVGDYIKGQLEVSRAKDGAAAARRALERMLAAEPELAATDANKVTRAQCFDVLDARKATPMATAKLRSMLGSAWEFALDAGRLDGNTPNWYIAVGPAVIAFRCWGLGVQRVGPTVGGFFSNLTPLFAALLSVAFLGEVPRLYHAGAFVLIIGGIVVSSRR